MLFLRFATEIYRHEDVCFSNLRVDDAFETGESGKENATVEANLMA